MGDQLPGGRLPVRPCVHPGPERGRQSHGKAASAPVSGVRPHFGRRKAHCRGLGRRRTVSGGYVPRLEPLGGVERPLSGRHAPVPEGGLGAGSGRRHAADRFSGYVRRRGPEKRLRQLHYLPRRVYIMGSVLLQREAQPEKRLGQHRRS